MIQAPYAHDLLHMHSHADCNICRDTKQRRHSARPVPESFKHFVKKMFLKTDLDHFILGDHIPGLFGEQVGLVARDELSGFVPFKPDKNKDHKSIAEGLRHHFPVI